MPELLSTVQICSAVRSIAMDHRLGLELRDLFSVRTARVEIGGRSPRLVSSCRFNMYLLNWSVNPATFGAVSSRGCRGERDKGKKA